MVPWNKGLKGLPPTKGFTGRKHSAQTKMKMSEIAKKSQIGNQNAYKCGCVYSLHEKAWKLFGKNVCSVCDKTNEQHIQEFGCRLDMHCTSEPKDYTLMVESNWETYCKKCHGSIDNGN